MPQQKDRDFIVHAPAEGGVMISEPCRHTPALIWSYPSPGHYINEWYTKKYLIESLTLGLVTYQECLKALKSLANGKTPGQDGITTDFYKFLWNYISNLVLNSINYAF